MESYLNDSYAVDVPYTTYTVYDWTCTTMNWVNDKIRVTYRLAVGDAPIRGLVFDDRNRKSEDVGFNLNPGGSTLQGKFGAILGKGQMEFETSISF